LMFYSVLFFFFFTFFDPPTKIVHDKGTFDAIRLNPDVEKDEYYSGISFLLVALFSCV
jgi:hypothetical protein